MTSHNIKYLLWGGFSTRVEKNNCNKQAKDEINVPIALSAFRDKTATNQMVTFSKSRSLKKKKAYRCSKFNADC